MKELYDIFISLETCVDATGYTVQDIPNLEYHKIGISKDKYPIFFIKSQPSKKVILDVSLDLISIQYNKDCKLYSNFEFTETNYYTLIKLKSNINEIQKYFLDILYLTIKKLPPIPNINEIRIEIDILIELFQSFSKPPLKTIQGLWAEMFIIDQSINPDYLVKAWHSSISSTFDFNDGIDKIEVKSTIKSKRIHRFSIHQLTTNSSSNTIIASVMTSETGVGLNIFDLRERIFKRLKSKDLILKIDTILSKTLGRDIEKAIDCFFDYNSSIDYLRFYSINNIPTIAVSVIPPQISSVNFDCDLTDVKPLLFSTIKSKLIESLNVF